MAGILNQKQLEEACLQWAYENALQDMGFQPEPTEPEDVTKWKSLNWRERDKANESVKARMNDLWSKFERYRSSIHNSNKSNFEYLKDMRRLYRKYGNIERINRVTEIIRGYCDKQPSNSSEAVNRGCSVG